MQPYGPPMPPYYAPPGYYPPYGYPNPYAVAPPRIPRPRGVPRRAPFLAGAVGHFIGAGASIAFGLLMIFGFRFDSGGPVIFNVLGAVGGSVLAAALFLQLIGFHGMWRNYGSMAGAAAIAYGFAALSIFVLASLLAPLAVEERCDWGWCFTVIASWGWALVLAAYAMLGAMFIVHGSAFIVNRFFLGNPGAAVASGVLFIIAGSFIASFLLAVYGGFFVLAPALIVGGVVLARAPLPSFPPGGHPWAPAAGPPVGPPGPMVPPGAMP